MKFLHVEGYVVWEYDIFQPVACPCDWLPYPHHHSRSWVKISMQRFRLAGPPLTREEYERILEDGV